MEKFNAHVETDRPASVIVEERSSESMNPAERFQMSLSHKMSEIARLREAHKLHPTQGFDGDASELMQELHAELDTVLGENPDVSSKQDNLA